MSQNFSKLNNIRTLRAQAREVSLFLLEHMLGRLTEVVEERRKKSEASSTAKHERAEKLQKYRKMLLEEGIDPADLLQPHNAGGKTRKKPAPRPAKYKYMDQSGHEKHWTGQGRMPSVIQAALNNGHSLKDFAI